LKSGDLVRFKKDLYLEGINKHETLLSQYKIGVLVEYKKWEKIASVLYNGNILRVRSDNVSKAGKRDFLIDNIT